jgi:hypothetical protein
MARDARLSPDLRWQSVRPRKPVAHWSEYRNMTHRPIFIVGPGRSGTTLMRSILSAHSRIAVTPETHFMARADANGLVNGAPSDFETFWSRYIAWVRFQDLDIDPDRCRMLIEERGDRSFRGIFDVVLTVYLERTGKARVGEKTPGHSLYLDQLLNWYPDAQVIVMQRDPRAVVASQLGTAYVQERMTPAARRSAWIYGARRYQVAWYARNWCNHFEDRLRRFDGDRRFHRVIYERLVSTVEDEVRAVCNFLNEPFEHTMLTDRGRDSVPLPSGRAANERLGEWQREHHARTREPITADSLQKWRSILRRPEVAMIEGHCGASMVRLGYSPTVTAPERAMGRALAEGLLNAEAIERHARAGARLAVRHLRRICTPGTNARVQRRRHAEPDR